MAPAERDRHGQEAGRFCPVVGTGFVDKYQDDQGGKGECAE
jgi:hypothetical protein